MRALINLTPPKALIFMRLCVIRPQATAGPPKPPNASEFRKRRVYAYVKYISRPVHERVFVKL